MRSLPAFPLLLLLLGLLLCTGDSWAEAGAEGPSSSSETAAKDDSPPSSKTEIKGKVKSPATAKNRRARLTQERDAVMAELLALEEGYSDLKSAQDDDAEPAEARLSGRLTELQTRLDRLDLAIANLKPEKK
jgi:hypothetical protein